MFTSFISVAQKPSLDWFFNEYPFSKKTLSLDTVGFMCLTIKNVQAQNPQKPLGITLSLIETLLRFRDKKGRWGEFLSFTLENTKKLIYYKIKLR